MLNQIAAKFLDATTDICPNWKMATPDPMVTVGVMCQGFPVEMIVRGYLCGSAWRAYKNGVREICGVQLPEGMKENQKFPEPIITPTTKAEMGLHDEDISKEEILKQGLATPEEYEILEKYTLALFKRGTEIRCRTRTDPVQKAVATASRTGSYTGQAVHYYDPNEIEVGKPIQCQIAGEASRGGTHHRGKGGGTPRPHDNIKRRKSASCRTATTDNRHQSDHPENTNNPHYLI